MNFYREILSNVAKNYADKLNKKQNSLAAGISIVTKTQENGARRRRN